MKRATRPTAGFTLVEMLVAIVVASILSAGMVQLFIVQNQAYLRQNDGVLASQNARAGFDMLVREMRNAGYDPRGLAGAGITNWSADSFGWSADLNADGDTLDDDEALMFYYHDAQDLLVRREGGSDLAVADGIVGLTFSYFLDDSGTVATSADEITQIRIEMRFSTPTGVMDGHLVTQVAVRNNAY